MIRFRHFNFIALLCFTALTILRRTALFSNPRFWAEEGSIYFNDAWHFIWYEVLFQPHIGYLSFFNNFAALAATLVQLEYAPLVTTLFALMAQLIPAIILLFFNVEEISYSKERKLICLIALLLVGPSQEVWLNSINSQFYFAVTTALLLFASPETKFKNLIGCLIILLAALTGPVSVALTPLFIWRCFKSRTPFLYACTLILIIGSSVQASILMHALDRRLGAQGAAGITFDNFSFILLTKHYIATAVGPGGILFVDQYLLPGKLTNSLTGLVLLGIMFYVWKSNSKTAITWFVTACWMSFFGYMGALNKVELLAPLAGQRYFFVPNQLLALSILSASFGWAELRPKIKSPALILLFALLIPQLYGFYSPSLYFTLNSWPNWQTEVGKWRADPNYRLSLAPSDKFSLRLYKHPLRIKREERLANQSINHDSN